MCRIASSMQRPHKYGANIRLKVLLINDITNTQS